MLRKLIRAKNDKIIISDTLLDKNTGMVDADKKNVFFGCVGQLSDIKTYLKLMEEELKTRITDIQNLTSINEMC